MRLFLFFNFYFKLYLKITVPFTKTEQKCTLNEMFFSGKKSGLALQWNTEQCSRAVMLSVG